MMFSVNTPKITPKTIAYLRVSTIDQDIEKNKAAILHLANTKMLGHVQFVEEKTSGKVAWKKRKIADILETAQKGDNIIVSAAIPGGLSKPAFIRHSHLSFRKPPCQNVALMTGMGPFSVGGYNGHGGSQSAKTSVCRCLVALGSRRLLSNPRSPTRRSRSSVT